MSSSSSDGSAAAAPVVSELVYRANPTWVQDARDIFEDAAREEGLRLEDVRLDDAEGVHAARDVDDQAIDAAPRSLMEPSAAARVLEDVVDEDDAAQATFFCPLILDNAASQAPKAAFALCEPLLCVDDAAEKDVAGAPLGAAEGEPRSCCCRRVAQFLCGSPRSHDDDDDPPYFF